MNIYQAQTPILYKCIENWMQRILWISHIFQTEYFYNILDISQAQTAAADNPDDDATETRPDLEEAGAEGETIQTNSE